MDAVLLLLRTLVVTVVGALLWLGSLFGVQLSAAPAPTSSATFPSGTAATTTLPVTSASKPKAIKQSATTTASQPAAPTPPADTSPALSTETLNTLARSALVNIFCTTGQGGTFNPISGSGVFIDSRGVILTNAHVAQYMLLADTGYHVQCVIRTGSPAQPAYTAEIMYLPPQWITDNADKIKAQVPTGTGENDYAFLLVTGSTLPMNPLPSAFPALPMSGHEPATGDRTFIAAYPAGFLGGTIIATSLYSTSANATVGQLFTFSTTDRTDLFSLGGIVVAQSGSSGGPVLSAQGKLEGIVATEVPGDTTSERDLRAITISHIDRSLAAAGLGGLSQLLLKDAASFAAGFNASTAPQETRALLDAIAK